MKVDGLDSEHKDREGPVTSQRDSDRRSLGRTPEPTNVGEERSSTARPERLTSTSKPTPPESEDIPAREITSPPQARRPHGLLQSTKQLLVNVTQGVQQKFVAIAASRKAKREAREMAKLRSLLLIDFWPSEQAEQADQAQSRGADKVGRPAKEPRRQRETQSDTKAEQELQQAEVEQARVREEETRRSDEQRRNAEARARIRAEQERREAEGEQARLRAEEETRQAEERRLEEARARIRAEQELRWAEAEQARLRAEEETRRAEERRLAEARTRIRAERREAEAEQARLRAEEETRQAEERRLAEARARIRAEQERQEAEAEQARLRAEEDTRRAEEERKLEESRARIRAEQERREAEAEQARLRAEEETRQAEERNLEESRARIRAEQELRWAQAEQARLRVEEETRRAEERRLAEWQASLRAEQERQRAEAEQARLRAEEQRLKESQTKHCPKCKRVFSGDRDYCLYDASWLVSPTDARLSAAPKPDAKAGSMVWLLVIITFLGAGIVGALLLDYVPKELGLTTPGETNQAANVEQERPVVGGALYGKEISLPNPDYPERAKREGVSGKVTVAVLVDIKGNVRSARVLNGPPLLQEPALVAARKAKFDSEKLIDQRARTSGTITYNFKL